ncbi:MAG: Re/Si-specific NAD(P)(+) transhydrogenase subunit alpha [Actinomycetota bacterium]|nr:Re/Si-specific NAD(P)(+) transhydrogenase subunit alpha [Actinomycetota bacterium]
MRIGIPREAAPETLVAATPKTVAALIKLGHRVEVEKGAGRAASFPDGAYVLAGADIVHPDRVWTADFIAKIGPPSVDEIGRLHDGGFIACLLAPARSAELLQSLATTGVTALAMDAVPRISRAQSLDVLSSMANLSGYRAVIEAAHAFGGLFTGQVTAAGKMPPARVFVVGAGVAGLAAIGTASSLGAVVRAFDVRPEVAEQVESMGAQFVAVDAMSEAPQRTDGYAGELTGDFEAAARVMYDAEARAADIVITTALIPGRPAPKLIGAGTVAAMKPGSVLVDLAAANGGNVEGTRTGERVVTPGGVTILGYTDLAGRLPTQASQLYGTNIVNLVKLLTPDPATGALMLNQQDQVLRGMTATNAGQVSWPPPPVAVTAAPAVPIETTSAATASVTDPRRRTVALALIAVVLALAATFSPPAFLGHLTVFVLAVVAGYYVISHVTHALHTPLMSVTNAISGIIAVGALLQVGSTNTAISVLSLAGIVVASINIFGGFTVTRRMLGMFRRD